MRMLNSTVLYGYVFARRALERSKCAGCGVPTDIEVADTAQGKWFESVLQVGAQGSVWGGTIGDAYIAPYCIVLASQEGAPQRGKWGTHDAVWEQIYGC